MAPWPIGKSWRWDHDLWVILGSLVACRYISFGAPPQNSFRTPLTMGLSLLQWVSTGIPRNPKVPPAHSGGSVRSYENATIEMHPWGSAPPKWVETTALWRASIRHVSLCHNVPVITACFHNVPVITACFLVKIYLGYIFVYDHQPF